MSDGVSSFLNIGIRTSLPLAIIAGGVAGFFALASQHQVPQSDAPADPIALVETVPVTTHDGKLDIVVDGLVVPYREIRLSAEVAGPIRYKSERCRPGMTVTKGTLLYEIDPRDFELEVERLTRDLEQSQATIVELGVELENTAKLVLLADEELQLRQREVQRIAGLGRGVTTESDVDRVKGDQIAAQNALTTLQNQASLLETRRSRLESAKALVAAQLDKARLDLSRTKITAPIDGVVVEDPAEIDSYVQRGTPLATIEDTSSVEVKCNLLMEDLYWIWRQAGLDAASAAWSPTSYELPPTPATVALNLVGHEFRWRGVLSRYDGMGLDERTRTVPCRVVVANPREVLTDATAGGSAPVGPPALVRGMYVSVRVHVDTSTTLLALPAGAVRPGNQAWRVADGKLDIRPLKVARRVAGDVFIYPTQDGLTVGDRIVVSPLATAFDGMPVKETSTPAEVER